MADDVWAWCEKTRAFGRTVTVKVKFQTFRQITRSRSHAGVVSSHEQLRAASLDLVRSIYPPETGIRACGRDRVELRSASARKDTPALPLFGAGAQSSANGAMLAEAH